MRRNAVCLLGITLVSLSLLGGCKGWGAKKQQAADAYDQYPQEPAGKTDRYYEPQPYVGSPTTGGTDYSSSTTGSKVHTVQKGDTLFSLARMYYNGDASKWKVIYEANRDKIPNKDQIRVGQKLNIP